MGPLCIDSKGMNAADIGRGATACSLLGRDRTDPGSGALYEWEKSVGGADIVI